MGVHKIKGESGISGEVRALSSVSHLHAFCKPGFSNRHPFDHCVVQLHLFLGVFEVRFIQHRFLSVGRCSDLLRAERSGDRIPVEARFSALVQTDPGAPPSLCPLGTGFFPGVKQPWRRINHPSPSISEVKESVYLYLYSPSGPSWLVVG